MALVDELKIHIKAGDGGDGIAGWLHEKGRDHAGPAGGDGGNGGNVYLKAVRDLSLLAGYRNEKEFRAERGENGKNKGMHGANGADLEMRLPIGSVVTNLVSGEKWELINDEERVEVLKGGRGGFGNIHFKGSKNIRPRQWTPGKPGEEADFYIELRLVADAGLIGLPNAGKSSLLNELTNASAKVGAYQFTTLEPNLGAFYTYILADIPGLIEGAAEGRGLGHKFLRHIRRTKLLLHCLSLENADLVKTYKTVRQELGKYSEELLAKPEVIVLTKTDALSPPEVKKAVTKMKKFSKTILTVSILDDDLLKTFKKELLKVLKA